MNKDVEFLIKIVRHAENFTNENFETVKKDDWGDYVTTADKNIENFLIEKLKSAYPTFDIVSEEFNTYNTPTDNCFIIDPIDGTLNFASGLPLFGIQVAIMKNGKVCGAVIDLPKLNEIYYADESGTYCNGKKVCVKKFEKKQALYAIEGRNRIAPLTDLKKNYPHSRVIGCCAVAHSWIAKGIFAGFLFNGNSCWDYIPGQYLVKQAGGFVINNDNLHIVASDKELALELLLQCSKTSEKQ